MSDPAKSPAEIEDVLSSIRRLVSEHQPGDTGASSQPSAPEAAEKKDEKLVLTAALRVTDPDDPWAPVAVQEQETAPSSPSFTPENRLSEFGDVSEVEVSDEAPSAEVEPALADEGEVSELKSSAEPQADEIADLDEPELDAEELAELALLDGEIPESAAFEPETGDDDWPDTSADRAVRDLAAMRGGAAVDDDPSSEMEQSEGEGAIDLSPAFEEVEVAGPETDMSDAEAEEIETTSNDAVDQVDAEFTPVFSRRSHDDPAETEEADASGAEAETAAEPEAVEAEVEDLGDTASPFTFPDDDEEDVLDEDTLRELIVDIVREELQGALGQRITRNVRKMVRREIRLALAAEELE